MPSRQIVNTGCIKTRRPDKVLDLYDVWFMRQFTDPHKFSDGCGKEHDRVKTGNGGPKITSELDEYKHILLIPSTTSPLSSQYPSLCTTVVGAAILTLTTEGSFPAL